MSADLGIHVDERGDHVCRHGVAMDVHCCGCHSGFIFDLDHECVGVDWGVGDARTVELRYCLCADPEHCREPVPGYVCKRGLVL